MEKSEKNLISFFIEQENKKKQLEFEALGNENKKHHYTKEQKDYAIGGIDHGLVTTLSISNDQCFTMFSNERYIYFTFTKC